MARVEDLLGKTLSSVERINDDEIIFTVEGGKKYKMHHAQDCCETVEIEDINGDLQDLVGKPITLAEESTNEDNPKDKWTESHTWTFYRFATLNGYVDIRWYGESNGYYSESVSFSEEGDWDWNW